MALLPAKDWNLVRECWSYHSDHLYTRLRVFTRDVWQVDRTSLIGNQELVRQPKILEKFFSSLIFSLWDSHLSWLIVSPKGSLNSIGFLLRRLGMGRSLKLRFPVFPINPPAFLSHPLENLFCPSYMDIYTHFLHALWLICCICLHFLIDWTIFWSIFQLPPCQAFLVLKYSFMDIPILQNALQCLQMCTFLRYLTVSFVGYNMGFWTEKLNSNKTFSHPHWKLTVFL